MTFPPTTILFFQNLDRGDGDNSENRGDRSPEVISSEGEDSRSSNQEVVWNENNNFQFHNPDVKVKP